VFVLILVYFLHYDKLYRSMKKKERTRGMG